MSNKSKHVPSQSGGGGTALKQLSAEEKIEFDKAYQESRALVAAGRDWSDLTLPHYRFVANEQIQIEKIRFESGIRRALLSAIRLCAQYKLPLPDWVSDAFIEAHNLVNSCRSISWDEAFGKPYPGRQLDALRKRRLHAFPLYFQAVQLHRAGASIGPGLFEALGNLHGVSKTRASNWYYEEEKKHRFSKMLTSSLAITALDPELRAILPKTKARADKSSRKRR